MSTLPTNIIVIDSREKTSGTNQNAVYSLLNVGGVQGTFELLGYKSSNQFYNVEVGVNDRLYWAEPGNLNATVPPGIYTAVTFNAAAKIVMDAASASTFTFTIDATTGKTTVAIAAGTFNWEWATNLAAGNSANALLGSNPIDTAVAVASIEGDYLPYLRLHTHVVMTITEEGSRNVDLLDGTEHSLIMPVSGVAGDDIDLRKNDSYQQIVTFLSNITNIRVILASETGVALVHLPDYTFLLRKLF